MVNTLMDEKFEVNQPVVPIEIFYFEEYWLVKKKILIDFNLQRQFVHQVFIYRFFLLGNRLNEVK